MADFEAALEIVLKNEGGLERDTDGNDTGGITKYGISLKFLNSLGASKLWKYGLTYPINQKEVINFTLAQVTPIYKNEFWDAAPNLAKIQSQKIATIFFDFSVTSGAIQSTKCLQRALNTNPNREILVVDGVFGDITLAAVNDACSDILATAYRTERGNFYQLLVRENPVKGEYLRGWLNRAYNT